MKLLNKNKNILPLTDRVPLKANEYCPIKFSGFRDTTENERLLVKLDVINNLKRIL